jgi:ribonuclease Z
VFAVLPSPNFDPLKFNRNNLRLHPVEVLNSDVEAIPPSSTLPTPTPVFQDKNISLYAYPLSPSSQPTQDDHTPEEAGSLKRKRETSPDSPRKKSNPELTNTPSSSTLDEPTLQALMADPLFSPEHLTGALADEWRRTIVNRMFPASQLKPKKSQDVLIDTSGNVDDYKRKSRNPRGWHDMLPPPHPSTSVKNVVAYAIVGPLIRGKFDVKKAEALGVPRGPLRGKLTRGETVTFNVEEAVVGEGGKETKISRSVTVKPEDCIEPPFPRSAVLVFDVPSPEYLPTLLQTFGNDTDSLVAKLRSQKVDDLSDIHVKSAFHILGDGVLEDPRYAKFMSEFGETVHHVVASREYCPNPVTFTSAAANQVRLNKLDDSIFPLPKFRMEPRRKISGQNIFSR